MEKTQLIIIGVALFFWGITMLVLIDIILKDFNGMKNKAVWALVASVPFIGWIIYLLFGYRKGIRRKPGTPV